jgi:hypothetical protein
MVFKIKAFVYRLFFTGKSCNYSQITLFLVFPAAISEKVFEKKPHAGATLPAYAIFRKISPPPMIAILWGRGQG